MLVIKIIEKLWTFEKSLINNPFSDKVQLYFNTWVTFIHGHCKWKTIQSGEGGSPF